MGVPPRERITAAVRDFLACLERKDIDSWIRLWDPAGEQFYPYGTEMFPPHLAGRDAVHERWKSMPDMFETLSFPLLDLWVDGDTAIARFDGHLVKKDGSVYRNSYICTFTFTEAGLIRRYREYFDPILAGAAFGLAETTYLSS
ncbi:nuclear transport factor 2 family protein [Streptomyces sp. WELS2]|uniref:nuclear transport factor 2 family protein n=1 Tax=Streptomyces sp. WELS2 TaxID=2749435 RepID=UPI0015F0D811|nr:nuclear transport factor 2 family protein [Streptomyces sp. WELS2]